MAKMSLEERAARIVGAWRHLSEAAKKHGEKPDNSWEQDELAKQAVRFTNAIKTLTRRQEGSDG